MTTTSEPRPVQASPLGLDLDVAYRQQDALDLADRQRLVRTLREERLRDRGARTTWWSRWRAAVATTRPHHGPAVR